MFKKMNLIRINFFIVELVIKLFLMSPRCMASVIQRGTAATVQGNS